MIGWIVGGEYPEPRDIWVVVATGLAKLPSGAKA
jgi:hypothetical protein